MDGDTTYNASMTVGAKDLYSVGAMSSAYSAAPVFAVQTTTAARLDNPGSLKLQHAIVSGGTEVDSAEFTMSATSYAYSHVIFNQTPAAAAWTFATVNAMNIGYLIGP